MPSHHGNVEVTLFFGSKCAIFSFQNHVQDKESDASSKQKQLNHIKISMVGHHHQLDVQEI